MDAFLWPLAILFMLVGAFALAAVIWAVLRERGEEKRYPVPEWDADARTQLMMWRHEDEKARRKCPDCKGTRCYDFNVNGRGCGDNPTEAVEGVGAFIPGRHRFGHVKLVPAGWWPLPKTIMGRANPHLWAKVADHAQILVTVRREVALP